MSVFVQQEGVDCDFSSSESWVILSPIEQSIKRKIQINYGIKTGFNDAFIISTEKRNEILANCQTEDEYTRTDELIRPILRGRDIKRYGYNWADLWLIATFPSRHYDIEAFPSVKKHLLSYGKERLEQTGKIYVVNGKKIKARKKTNNKWFETQDSISYWDDFSKPKVMWKIIGCNINFCYDEQSMICNNAVDWYLKTTTEAEVQGGGIQLYVTTLEKTLLKLDFPKTLTDIIYKRIIGSASDNEVDKAIFDSYGLTISEQEYISNCNKVNRGQ